MSGKIAPRTIVDMKKKSSGPVFATTCLDMVSPSKHVDGQASHEADHDKDPAKDDCELVIEIAEIVRCPAIQVPVRRIRVIARAGWKSGSRIRTVTRGRMEVACSSRRDRAGHPENEY